MKVLKSFSLHSFFIHKIIDKLQSQALSNSLRGEMGRNTMISKTISTQQPQYV